MSGQINKKDIQPALNVLVALHENDSALDEIRDLGGMQHSNNAQQGIAGVVRYLMMLRDNDLQNK